VEAIKTNKELITQVKELQSQLSEAHDIIDAIRGGEVDAFIIKNEDKNELYTLKSADKAYRIFIEKMNDGALTINKDGIILYSNSSFADLIDIPLANITGFLFLDFIPDAYKNVVKELIKTAWQEEESKAEIILPGKDDNPVPVLLSMNTFEIDGGIALSVIATDISLQKETQKQKKEMEKKDEFISIASHELKTPVTSIKGYVQILRFNFQKEGNLAAAELLNKVDNQVNKLTTLISDLLDVKKIENGQLQYHEELFDFNELVNETIEETSRVLNKHSFNINLAQTKLIYGDKNKIGQVITNLIDNAGKYSSPGTAICVNTIIEANKVKFSVQDFGIGVPKDQQIKIFDRFFRVNGEKENTYSGLGLGLYISSEIIKRHKGFIGVESKENEGSTFYFELPFTN
jgi:PAS domain S-box-containing protein